MVLGVTHERPTLGRRGTASERAEPAFGWDDWQIERGAVTWAGVADSSGGFPGFANHAGRLDGRQVRVTERFLLVDEGRRHGFGLPLPWLIDADVIASPFRGDRDETVLRVRYSDRDRARTFLLRFREPFLMMRPGRRAEQALAALRAVGLEARDEALPPLPEVAHSWLEVSRFEQENVLWSGVASAALGPGNELEPCDVWLTTRSVIWGGDSGDGVLRLPLERLLDVVAADAEGRGRAPAVYLACADEAGGRHDLPFVFDRHHSAQRCLQERGALLNRLRSRGVALGSMSAPPQPWRAALARVAAADDRWVARTRALDLPFRDFPRDARLPAPPRAGRTTARGLAVVRGGDAVADDPARWALGPDLPAAAAGNDMLRVDDLDHTGAATRLADAGGRGTLTLLPPVARSTESAAEARSAPPPEDGQSSEGPESIRTVDVPSGQATQVPSLSDAPKVRAGETHEAGSPLNVVDTFEDAIVAVLVESARGIERCLSGADWVAPVTPVPSAAQQLAAHAALDGLLSGGVLDSEELRSRRCRLVAAGDAGPRLRSLLELRLVGLITDAQLAQKRSEIMGPLGDVLQGGRG